MKLINKHIPAFTLWEVIFTLVITTMIVSLSYGGYHRMTNMIENDVSQSDTLYSILQLERELTSLVERSISMDLVDDEIILRGTDNSLVFFEEYLELWEDDILTRTFTLEDWMPEYLDDSTDLISRLDLTLPGGRQLFTIVLHKSYPVKLLYPEF